MVMTPVVIMMKPLAMTKTEQQNPDEAKEQARECHSSLPWELSTLLTALAEIHGSTNDKDDESYGSANEMAAVSNTK